MSKAIKTFAIAMVIAAFAPVAFAQDESPQPSQEAPSFHHRGPIYNGFDHQPTQQDLPPAVRREEGHVTPSERDFDKSLEICRPC
jgi:hypothetical protein